MPGSGQITGFLLAGHLPGFPQHSDHRLRTSPAASVVNRCTRYVRTHTYIHTHTNTDIPLLILMVAKLFTVLHCLSFSTFPLLPCLVPFIPPVFPVSKPFHFPPIFFSFPSSSSSDIANKVLLALFTGEMLLKMYSLGLQVGSIVVCSIIFLSILRLSV